MDSEFNHFNSGLRVGLCAMGRTGRPVDPSGANIERPNRATQCGIEVSAGL